MVSGQCYKWLNREHSRLNKILFRSLTHHPLPSTPHLTENPRTAALPHRDNLFSLCLTSALAEKTYLKTPALGKYTFIRQILHWKPAVPL